MNDTPAKPHLSRNMNGDLLLIEGDKRSVVATSFSALWYAIIAFGDGEKSAAPTPLQAEMQKSDEVHFADNDGQAKSLQPQSMLRAVGERLVCYCPPGVCQAPPGFRGPCNRASDQPKQTMAEKLNVDPAWADEATPKAQAGTWTLTAPDGRTWIAESPLRVCAAESRERVPAHVALARIARNCDEDAALGNRTPARQEERPSEKEVGAAPLPVQGQDTALDIALDALGEIALAGMGGTGMESGEAMTAWHARRAWEFIGIAARAKDAARAALRASSAPTTKGTT